MSSELYGSVEFRKEDLDKKSDFMKECFDGVKHEYFHLLALKHNVSLDEVYKRYEAVKFVLSSVSDEELTEEELKIREAIKKDRDIKT